MRRLTYVRASVAAALLLSPSLALAQAQDAQALRQEIDQLRRDFEARLAALEARLAAMPGGQPAAPAAPPGAGAAGRRRSRRGAGASRRGRRRRPERRVAGLRVGGRRIEDLQSGHGGDRQFPRLRGARMPWRPSRRSRCRSPRRRSRRSSIRTRAPTSSSRSARAASSVEEGFVTFTALPGGLLTKVGKMRAAFGKVNTLHTHVLPWADRPLVIGNLVGGEDGISDAGVSVARLIPNPLDLPRSDRPGLPRRLGRHAVPIEQARRPELRRPPARLSRPDGIDQRRPRRCRTRAATIRRGSSTASTSDGSRPTCAASTRPSAGSRCSARSTARSSAAAR